MEPRVSGGALFREIHKNTWLRRLNVEGKRPSVLTKKPDRYWVVFCVHGDCEAFLEGYADPRQAPSHNPEWSLALQTVQHISHALVPVEQEFEFVITLGNDVARFNANTWDCMQEWVESLRSKLREMKLLSPKENLYSKLPEAKPPLAPTRDPTSPLPATPPVPAAIVPGIERVQPSSLHSVSQLGTSSSPLTSSQQIASNPSSFSAVTPLLGTSPPHAPSTTAMSNTSTQNLMNLLTNPLQAVSSINNQHISSQHLFDAISLASDLSDGSIDDYSTDIIKQFISSGNMLTPSPLPQLTGAVASTSGTVPSSGGSSSSKAMPLAVTKANSPLQDGSTVICSTSLAKTFANNVLADPGTASLKRTEQKVLVDVKADTFGFSTDSESDEDVVANNSTGTSSSRSSSTSKSSSIGLPEENGNESSLPAAVPTARQSSATPITSLTQFCKTRQEHRHEQKKTRRKYVQKEPDPITDNVTIIEVSNGTNAGSSPAKSALSPCAKRRTSKPESKGKTASTNTSTLITDGLSDENYKSNVQIIPSNIEYEHNFHRLQDQEPSIIASINDRQITTVKVPNLVNTSSSGTVIITSTAVPPAQSAQVIATVATSSTPIKADNNFGTVTQIAVNSCDRPQTPPSQQQHYEHVFLLPTPIQVVSNLDQPTSLQSPSASAVSSTSNKHCKSKVMLLSKQQRSSSHSEIQFNRVKNLRNGLENKENQVEATSAQPTVSGVKPGIFSSASSPTVPATTLSPTMRPVVDKNIYTPQPQRPMLQRGLTEMVISRSTNAVVASGRDDNASRGRQPSVNLNLSVTKFRNEVNEQRRRSSSTSDAQPESSGSALPRARLNGVASRLQSPPQPFRPHHQFANQQDQGINGSNRKLTLREQQVMQLRREMMHPGGVQLQLRRKDCINSIGLVDAFGAVWVAGWKQKEHPVLYNALHIGDQLISIAGIAITSAAEAHKAIRGAPGLFVKLIIRRVPFGRVFAIRRELNGQCLGLIRDGNTATIVDVVPNSLAARHGLPPKAQSCDGLSLTFWVLTEINGRPLNLFFKDNEIRDRLNAVGKDISILVQPADLVTKLKKQLKSLRGHKDFIVQ
ncbi:uncharacterized protein LOC129726016 isoform X2 [Wyeomyia smithii]|uniref:uncharacterized protein LOC129726016 isoform X2 n=1 Tax=Wyeomyia smithii TaxID=174621 RepID=UPI002467D7FD|nr:uncharacterized protein LOC129726016 isoform X2 [Wyeomyia smithii]